jgi:ligand-binding sensor domain-containing protein/signal transduction histidine kinase
MALPIHRTGVRLAVALAVALAAPAAWSLDPHKAVSQFQLQSWSTEQGLPQSTVFAIAQTPEGYLWLGTEEGLARFDGVRFHTFDPTNTPALRQAFVTSLATDRQGSLWIGLLAGGVVRLKDGRFTAYGVEEGLTDDRVRVVYHDREGRLWAGANQGLSLFRDGRFLPYGAAQGLAAVPVRALCQTRDGSLWIGTRGHGLHRWRDGRRTVLTTRDGLPDDVVLDLHEDGQGRLWIGTAGGGLARWEDGRLRRDGRDVLPPRITGITSDRAGNLWLATPAGLFRQREGRFEGQAPREGSPPAAVVSVFEDREGSLWVGTRTEGLRRLVDGRFTAYTTKEGLSKDSAWSVYEDAGGALWIGTDGGGLNRLQGGMVRRYTTREGLASDVVETIWQDRRGALWVGTDKGVTRIEGERLVTLGRRDGLADDVVTSILEDREGSVWIATHGGLHRWRDGRLRAFNTQDGLSSNQLSALHEGRDGSLWIGTLDGGLNRWQDGRVTRYGEAEGLRSRNVNAVHEDADGVLWIATTGGGVSRLRDGRLFTFGTRDGLPSDTVFQILEDGQARLWMSSNKGVFRVARADLAAYAEGTLPRLLVTTYGVADGMPSAECNGGSHPAGWKGRDGRLWFPTTKGVVVVDPDRPDVRGQPLTVVIEEMRVNHEPVAFGGDLPPGSNAIEIQYTGLSLAAPERIRFRYRLEGFDRDWFEAGVRRAAYYTNLPPGAYRFRVAARNHDGDWSEAKAPVAFRIRPRFYQTAWFLVLAGAAALLLAARFHRFRVALLDSRNAVLEERNRIAQEVHDGVAQGIGGIAMQLEVARGCADAADAATHVDRARGLADQTLKELRRSLSALRPVLLDGLSLPEALEQLLEPLQSGTGIKARLEVQGVESELSRDLENQLLRIAQEAVYNSTRHGRPGQIGITLAYHSGRVCLRILDDGLGYEVAAGPPRGGFGLRSMRERVERLGGRLAVRSEPGRGAEVAASFPVRRRAGGALAAAWRAVALSGSALRKGKPT